MADISKEDLFLMMRSYENTVRLNTSLHERQEVLVTEQGKVIENLSEITNKQAEINRHLVSLVDKLTRHADECTQSVTDITQMVTDNQADLLQVSNEIRTESLKNHGKTNNKLIAISGGFITVIIALITVFFRLWEKSDLVDAIAKHLGV